jgi:putative addiction module component (TIGR02574 family)
VGQFWIELQLSRKQLYRDVMGNHPLLKVDIAELSIAERIQLAEDLWDSISEQQEEVPLTEVQQRELDRRLENYAQDPSAGSDWESIKARLGYSQ